MRHPRWRSPPVEYGYDTRYFEHMRNAVDVLQADATRCLGVTGFMQVSSLCDLHGDSFVCAHVAGIAPAPWLRGAAPRAHRVVS